METIGQLPGFPASALSMRRLAWLMRLSRLALPIWRTCSTIACSRVWLATPGPGSLRAGLNAAIRSLLTL